jgi:hypothetical protein
LAALTVFTHPALAAGESIPTLTQDEQNKRTDLVQRRNKLARTLEVNDPVWRGANELILPGYGWIDGAMTNVEGWMAATSLVSRVGVALAFAFQRDSKGEFQFNPTLALTYLGLSTASAVGAAIVGGAKQGDLRTQVGQMNSEISALDRLAEAREAQVQKVLVDASTREGKGDKAGAIGALRSAPMVPDQLGRIKAMLARVEANNIGVGRTTNQPKPSGNTARTAVAAGASGAMPEDLTKYGITPASLEELSYGSTTTRQLILGAMKKYGGSFEDVGFGTLNRQMTTKVFVPKAGGWTYRTYGNSGQIGMTSVSRGDGGKKPCAAGVFMYFSTYYAGAEAFNSLVKGADQVSDKVSPSGINYKEVIDHDQTMIRNQDTGLSVSGPGVEKWCIYPFKDSDMSVAVKIVWLDGYDPSGREQAEQIHQLFINVNRRLFTY